MKRISYVLLFILIVFLAIIFIKRQYRVSKMAEKQQKEEAIVDTHIIPTPIEELKKTPEKMQPDEKIKIDLINNDPYVEGVLTDIMRLDTEQEDQKKMLADLTLNFLTDIKKIKDNIQIPDEVKKGKITELFRVSEAISNRVDENIRKDYLSLIWGKNTIDIAGKRLDEAVEEKYQDVLRVLFAAGGHKNVELDDETDKMINYYVYELVRGQYDNANFINENEADENYSSLIAMLSKFYELDQIKLGMPSKYWFKID